MLFNSFAFAIFLPIVFGLYWLLPHRFRWGIILSASYYFYMSWNPRYVTLILFTTIISYLCGILLDNPEYSKKWKRWILFFALITCLGVLFIFKYFNFFSESLFGIMNMLSIPMHPVTLKLMLPVGISFYTFQTLSYVIDVYRGEVKAERHFGVYAAFVSFFPQLVAGPIERSANLLHQISEKHNFCYEQAAYGMKLLTWGFFKKMVVADHLAIYVDRIYNHVILYQGFSLIMATLFFTFQIYCDFSGYSDIARGTAKLFGIELMVNFKSPYFSASVKEFWIRWHISLSTWFRDYVYIPLGGSRVVKWKHYRNLMVTFLVSGLWHGAAWTFVLWGSLHGMAQIGERFFFLKKAKQGISWWIRVILVFLFASLAWSFFRANSIYDAVYLLTHLFSGISSFPAYLKQACYDMGFWSKDAVRVALNLGILFTFDYASLKTDVIIWVGNKKTVVRYLFYFSLVTYIIFNRSIVESAFIYFQF